MNKILKIIVNTILVIVILLLSIYAVLRFANKIEIFKVQTGSMEDGIHVGDYILIVKGVDYKLNDVVTFKKEDCFITHRIIEDKGDSVITKGDANNIKDEEIPKSSIVGKVIIKGGILNFVINFKYALASLFFAFYLLTYYFDKEKQEEQDEEMGKEQESEIVEKELTEQENINKEQEKESTEKELTEQEDINKEQEKESAEKELTEQEEKNVEKEQVEKEKKTETKNKKNKK